jgi:drug/metabolite transporter (DMT)-like permease
MVLNRGSAFLAGIFSVLCWASIPVVMKLGLEIVPLTYFLFLRFLVASVFCLMVTRIDFVKCTKLSLRQWAFLSVLLAANFILQAIAIREIPATLYIAIFSLSPLISLLCVRASINSKSAVGIVLALVGTLVFALSSGQLEGLHWKGLPALLGGMMTWALYVPSVQSFQKIFTDRQVSAITSCVSFIPVTLLWLIEGAPVAKLSPQGYLAIAIVGLLVPIAYWAFLYSVRHLPVFGISSQYLEPVFGFAFAVFILGETLTFSQVIGGFVILSGVALMHTQH